MNHKKLISSILGLFTFCIFLFGETIDTSYFMYVSLRGDNQVKLYKIDKVTGTPEIVYSETVTGGPASLALHSSKQYLYVAQRTSFSISAYKINQATGRLTLLNTISAVDNPVYISVDKTGKFLLSAYYSANKAAVYGINTDGSLKSAVIKSITTGTNPHAILTDPTDKYMYITNMTGNRIEQFQFDSLTGNFTALTPAYFTPPANTGPRHFVFYPLSNIIYVVNELGNSITAYHYEQNTGLLSEFQTITALPTNYTLTNKSADIHLSPDNRFLYASNRGYESIVVFSINQNDGTLSTINQYFTTTSPREFDITPSGNFLYSAGETYNDLAWYRINKQTGELDSLNTISVGKTPSWVLCTEIISTITSDKHIQNKGNEALNLKVFPNPLCKNTTIQYFLNKPTTIKLLIYNSKGQLLSIVKDRILEKGLHIEDCSVIKQNGERLNPGIYYCKLITETETDSVKLIVL